jgi:hypothetical protein
MTDLPTLLSRQATLQAEAARVEAAIRKAEREYWQAQGYTVMPRRERLLAALREDAKQPTPLELYIEGMAK